MGFVILRISSFNDLLEVREGPVDRRSENFFQFYILERKGGKTRRGKKMVPFGGIKQGGATYGNHKKQTQDFKS
jgi:hypothetical protein